MNRDEVRGAVLARLGRIAPDADLAHLRSDVDLRTALEIDSFDFLSLLSGLHQDTGVEVPELDYGKVSTLDALVDYLAARVR